MRIHCGAAAIALLGLFCACGPDRSATRDSVALARQSVRANDSASAVRAALVAELRRQAERSVLSPPFDVAEDRVQFSSEPSTIIPGLVYHWATYAPPMTSHVNFRAVIGEHAGRREVIRDAADWGVLARRWRPASPLAAERACRELVNVIATRTLPDVAGRMDDTTWLRQLAFQDSAALAPLRRLVAASPDVRNLSADHVTRVQLWAFNRVDILPRVRQYRCELPYDSTAGPGLVRVREIGAWRYPEL